MPSKKAMDQCLTWLNSKAADKDSLDGINAEICLNVILEQKEKLNKLGAQFHQVRKERDILRETPHLEDLFDKEKAEKIGVELFEF